MTYGIEFSNGSQQRIISDRAYNFHYIGQATLTDERTTSAGALDSIKGVMLHTFVIATSTPPICFIEGGVGVGYGIVQQRDLGGGSWEIIVASFPRVRPTLHCFAPIPPSAGLANPNGWGIAVFDAGGRVVLDPDKKQLDYLYFASVNTPACVPDNGVNQLCVGTATTTLGPMSSRPAFMFCSRGRAVLNRSSGDQKKFIHLAAISGDSVVVSWGCCFFSGPVMSPVYEESIFANTIMVIDVNRLA